MKCVARDSDSSDGKCGRECEQGFKYCERHKGRKAAVEERLRSGVSGLSNNTPVYDITGTQKEFQDEHSQVVEEDKVEDNLAKREVQPVVNNTSHGTIVDQVNGMLQRVVDMEFNAFNEFNKLDPADWRYRDKAGAEQIRGEVAIYERAMDRSLRALTQITKLGIEQQAAIVDKAQYEGVRTAIHRTLVRMGFDERQISETLKILAEEFSRLVR